MRRGSVFAVPSGAPFLPSLVRALLSGAFSPGPGDVPDALDLSSATILLPTRRSERALADAFLSISGRSAMLLPQIRAISGPDEDLLLLGGDDAPAGGGFAESAIDLPPAIDAAERLLLLTRLVLQWSRALKDSNGAEAAFSVTPAQACAMARELAQLMDLVEREGKTLDGIADLVPETYSEHWQKSLDFLRIITEFWPSVLAERGLMSPWERQNELLRREAQRMLAKPPEGPVIVAGVSGSIPATVDLMNAILTHECGAVVLPGLDLCCDDASWAAIGDEHPEHPDGGFKRLLEELGTSRSDVAALPGAEVEYALEQRGRFVGEAMRPTATTARWHDWVNEVERDTLRQGLEDLHLIEAATPPEEAEAIALIMRETAEHKGKSAALITPDRLLARRVAIRLEAWGIRVDDSAGRPFVKTVPGTFFDLVIEALAKDFAPVAMMALLKHPLARFGLSAREVRFAARALELNVFRAPYIGSGLDGISAGLERARSNWLAVREGSADTAKRGESDREERASERMWLEDWERAHDLIGRIKEALAPLRAAFQSSAELPLNDLAARHAQAAEAACSPSPEELELGAELALYQDVAGRHAAAFFERLVVAGDAAPVVRAHDYPDLYRGLVATLPPVIASVPKHPSLSIWGPMESQLLSADVVVLGSLNEGTWPPGADPGPWLNRPMRRALGLPSPEEDTGREARGFVSLLGAPEVYLTRSRKADGVPTVPSRWLMRMLALASGAGVRDALEPPAPWLGWARARDVAARPESTVSRPPAPRPPLRARPRRMSVSGIERWSANPYAVFAADILKLRAMQKLGAEPDAALKGQILHEAMSRFTRDHPLELPPHPADVLTDLAKDVLADYLAHPKVAAFWVPRFARFAVWFADTEPGRRARREKTMAEIDGRLTFESPGGDFRLTARADRLDAGREGVVITDYKTGSLPNKGEVQDGRKPQLPLEAAIAMAGGFAGLPRAQSILDLRYIKASGGEPPGEERSLSVEDGLEQLAHDVLERVRSLVHHFDDPNVPYTALRRSGYSYAYDDYAHLARVAEWAQGETTDDGDGGGGA